MNSGNMVIVDEDTPSPPLKPPRGVFRDKAPMKPQRSALRIEPLANNNKENHVAKAPKESQFKATDKMEQMQAYFKRSVDVIRRSSEFTGTEAADILTAYIETHRHLFERQDIGRANAVKLLEIWRREGVLKNVGTDKEFVDSDRSFYTLGTDHEHSYFICHSPTNSTTKLHEDSQSFSSRGSSRRNNSFKRLFSPLNPLRRNRSNSRGREKDEKSLKENTSAFMKSTWSIFSSVDKQEKKAKQAAEQLVKEEEAEVYELALFHLLNIIEVEFLEDVALPIQDSKKNASFLSSIMEKMGLGHNEDQLTEKEEGDMDLMIATHPLIRQATPWFQMARMCAPLLYLQPTIGKSNVMQLYLWCKAALTTVSTRLEKMTQNGASPLFPNEFGPLLTKIAQQLINDMDSGEKLNLAILYIYLMVPQPLRSTIDNLVHWLQLTLRTDAVEDLRSPYYLGRKEPKHKENCKVIIEEIRPFIFPNNCMTPAQQSIFMMTLVELRMEGRLGQLPKALENALKFKSVTAKGGENDGKQRKKKRGNDEPLTPVRFTVPNQGSRKEKARKSYEGLSETDIALVQMIEKIMDDAKITLTEKKKRLTDFSKIYPALYNRFFKGTI